MQKHLKEEKGIFLDGGQLEHLITEAGFTEVTAKKLKIEIGDWGPGPFHA
jgi:hypothetical protein